MKTIIVEAITEITANNSLLNRKAFMYSPNLHEALKIILTQARGLYLLVVAVHNLIAQSGRTIGSLDENKLPARNCLGPVRPFGSGRTNNHTEST